MAYLMRYSVTIKEIGPNGLGMNGTAGLMGVTGPPNGQAIEFFCSTPVGSQTFTATDISNIATAIGNDISAQLTAAQSRIQGFATGGG